MKGAYIQRKQEERGRLYISEIILFSEFLEEDASIRHSEGGHPSGRQHANEANLVAQV